MWAVTVPGVDHCVHRLQYIITFTAMEDLSQHYIIVKTDPNFALAPRVPPPFAPIPSPLCYLRQQKYRHAC